MDDEAVRGRVRELEAGLARLEGLPEGERDRVLATFTELHELYGETLRRMVERVLTAGGVQLLARVSEDELVGAMLVLHGLQPPSPVDIQSSSASPNGEVAVTISGPRSAEQSPPPESPEQRCELCSEPLEERHGHVVDVSARELLCSCRPCTILFDRPQAGGDHFRRVSERCEQVTLDLTDEDLAALGVPVEVAFITRNGASGAITAFYPSPAGATESEVDEELWRELEERNPDLASIEPDVEALLVNRRHDARDYWALGVDQCYRLVGMVREHWSGFTGGDEVWSEIDRFFEELRDRSAVPAR